MRRLIWIGPVDRTGAGLAADHAGQGRAAAAHPAEQLVGTWRLVHEYSEDIEGERTRVGVNVETLTFTRSVGSTTSPSSRPAASSSRNGHIKAGGMSTATNSNPDTL